MESNPYQVALSLWCAQFPARVCELGRPSWADLDYQPVACRAWRGMKVLQYQCKPVCYGSDNIVGLLLPVRGPDDIGPAHPLFARDDLQSALSRASS